MSSPRRLGTITFLCVFVVATAIFWFRAGRRGETPVPPDKTLTPAQRAGEVEAHLDAVAEIDQGKTAPRFDMTAEEIEKASSVELVMHFTASPLRVWFGLYDDRNLGVRRAIRGSRTLQAFVQRPDMIEAIVESNRIRMAEIREARPGSEITEGLSMHLMCCDELLLYPEVFEKTRGHEKDLLQVMCERYRAMVEANARFPKETEPFGASFTTITQVVLQLAQRIDPGGNWTMPELDNEAEWYERAEKLAQNGNS